MKAWTLALAVAFLALSRPAFATTRLAVLIVADEPQLSDNLSEVAIASLAERPGYELLGLSELKDRLAELPTVRTDGLRACLLQAACLGELGRMVAAPQALVGHVRREGARFRLELALVELETGNATARLTRESSIELTELIAAVQAGVRELVTEVEPPPVAPPPPFVPEQPKAPPPSHAASTRAARDDVPSERKPSGESVLPYVAYGSAALAVVAFSAAVVTGTIGTARPEGRSRADVQADLERRKDYAALANGLYVTGGVLAGVSAVAFIVPWD
jgi:hypothetical protein